MRKHNKVPCLVTSFIVILLVTASVRIQAAEVVTNESLKYLSISNGTIQEWDVIGQFGIEVPFSPSVSGIGSMGLSIPMVHNAAIAENAAIGRGGDEDDPTIEPSEQAAQEYQGVPFEALLGLKVKPFQAGPLTPYLKGGASALLLQLRDCDDPPPAKITVVAVLNGRAMLFWDWDSSQTPFSRINGNRSK